MNREKGGGVLISVWKCIGYERTNLKENLTGSEEELRKFIARAEGIWKEAVKSKKEFKIRIEK